MSLQTAGGAKRSVETERDENQDSERSNAQTLQQSIYKEAFRVDALEEKEQG